MRKRIDRGREVRSFLSETDLENDIAFEMFLLGEPRPDMSGFEESSQANS